MKPAAFDYHAPRDVDEVLAFLDRYGADAKVLAGGQSLVPLMNFRLARPAHVVDINRVEGLAGIRTNGSLKLGALTRQREIETATFTGAARLLQAATRFIGHPGIRARGTVGGTIAHNDPAAEYPAALLALDATVTARSRQATRTITVDDLLGDWLTTALEPNELITEITVPIGAPDARVAITELAKRQGDFALAGAAVRLDLADGGDIRDARVVAFGGLSRATRMREAEAILIGGKPSDETLRAAAEAAGAGAEPTDDIHATREYRRHLIRVLTRRALQSALETEA